MIKRFAYPFFFLLCVVACDSAPVPNPVKKSMDKRATLLERIGDINNNDLPRPLVGLELFFEGNDDLGSIGCNLPGPVSPADFYALLKDLRKRSDVRDILIEVKDQEDPDGWPFSDTIWFITSADPAEVKSWFPENLAPDDVVDGFSANIEPYKVPDGFRAVGAWYD